MNSVDFQIYIMMCFQIHMMMWESFIFCDFIQNNPPEGKELRMNKIPRRKDISSISFPWKRIKARENKPKVYPSKCKTR